MNTLKYNNMRKNYDGFQGPRSFDAVRSQLPTELLETCTGKQLGLIMGAINKAFHNGRSETGAEIIDGSGLWISTIPEAGILEINAIRSQLPELKKMGIADQFRG